MILNYLLIPTLVTTVLSDQVHFNKPTNPTTKLLSSDFSNFANSLIQEWGVPGLSVGIVKLGGEDVTEDRMEFYSYGTAGKSGKVNEDVSLF